ncbi:uncharacterized protein [Littorina saxatilis]|uniref:Uncharacterized protein n=1 Tax=Littorina saxatilis TaxID=31220 RepID=A0AAN9GAT3_9CAEN
MELCLKIVLTVVFFSTLTDGATFWSTDACPKGVNPGESWEPDVIPGTETASECMRCNCFQPGRTGFECGGCGAIMPPELPSPACYITKAAPDQPYPECCRIAPRCPGDVGYNPTMAKPNGDIVG